MSKLKMMLVFTIHAGIYDSCWYLRFILVFTLHAGIYDTSMKCKYQHENGTLYINTGMNHKYQHGIHFSFISCAVQGTVVIFLLMPILHYSQESTWAVDGVQVSDVGNSANDVGKRYPRSQESSPVKVYTQYMHWYYSFG